MNRKLKVLVITYLPWRNDTSVGNSYSNIFNGMSEYIEFSHIYFRDGMPENEFVHKYFHISEKAMMKSIFCRKSVGRAFCLDNPMDTPKVVFSKKYNRIRRLRWESFLFVRDMVGRLGKWKSNELLRFVDEFKPDIIFGTLVYIPVVNELMLYLKDYLKIPLITYPWDDYYSLKRISFSPMFWIRNLSERRLIKKCAEASAFLYTITEQMQHEYTKYFNKECRLLYKGYNFGDRPSTKEFCSKPIEMIYMGNIGSGRWKVIGKLAEAVKQINSEGENSIRFRVYTLSPIDDGIKKAINISEFTKLMEPVSNEEVLSVMNSADILLHVEPTTLKDRSFFRLSFSTKIVDYLYSSRCIFAAGGRTAAMDYLVKNDAARVVLNENDFYASLKELVDNPELIIEYGNKAWDCGKKNHDIKVIQDRILADFYELLGEI